MKYRYEVIQARGQKVLSKGQVSACSRCEAHIKVGERVRVREDELLVLVPATPKGGRR